MTQSRQIEGRQETLQLVPSALVEAYLAEIEASVIERQTGLGAITVVGHGFWQSPETLARITQALGETPVLLQESRNTGVTVCVATRYVEATLERLHRELIASAKG
jgi:aspartokinase